jgi:hypothetical protein
VRTDRTIRIALWSSVALNLAGLVIFTGGALGRPSSLLSLPIAPFYSAQLAMMIGLFGCAYAWLAMQPSVDLPLLLFGAIGKVAFFMLFVLYWVVGDLSWPHVAQASPELVLGLVYLWWIKSRA